jgi:8-hydroxy-5-deazaflavin:NADPH oxidoreductase
MRVGVLGSGDVGRVLAKGFADRGHDVRIGTRDPANPGLEEWRRSTGSRATAATFRDAARHGELVILATRGSAAEDVIDLAGAEAFEGKIVLDATNPLDFSGEGAPGLFVGLTDSLGERIQRRLPAAKVVKCFNTVPNSLMVDPAIGGPRAEMLVCGDDAAAKATTAALLKELGWAGVIDIGGIDGARWLEALVPLWVRTGRSLGTFRHLFVVAR